MVETRPTLPSLGGPIPESGGRRTGGVLPPATRPIQKGRPGNRWPNPLELAALMVDGILRLPARYRRGMFLDVVC